LEDKDAEDIVLLDLRGASSLADYFIFATADSTRQFRGFAETLRHVCKASNIKVGHAEGLEAGRWLLLDLFEVIVHVFDPEAREYYDLELLWGDVPRVDWAEVETPPVPRGAPTRDSSVRPASLPE